MDGSAQFRAEEYLVIVLMLALSLLIGLYFSCCTRQDSYNDYMLGGRAMGVFPVAMSMVATHLSGMALVGNPAEVYSYGTLYGAVLLSDAVIPFINIALFLPTFYNLQINSAYEYLELRFGHTVRVVGSLIFIISQILYMPAYIYVPALVLHQISGLSVVLVASVVCGVCIFYTTFGGLKAVLWTDAVQNIFSLVALLCVLVLGVGRLGGVHQIFHACDQGHRLEFFNLELSPFVRNSFWTMVIGNTGNWLALVAIHPAAVQRSLSVPSLDRAKRVLLWTAFGVMFVHGLTVFMGMMLYARYAGCDPVATGEVKKKDQLLPLFVMEITRDYPGLAGLFVSGILSAALSSISSSINTTAGSLYEDLVEYLYRGRKPSDVRQAVIMKAMTLGLGVFCVSLTLAIDKTDSLFQIGMSLTGVTNGALLTLFILGMFVPRANTKGALSGALFSLLVMAWVVGRTQYYFATGELKYPAKVTSVDLCPRNYTGDIEVQSRLESHAGYSSPVVAAPGVSLLYQLSYMYYTPLGTLLGLAVGLLVSLLTEPPSLSSMDRQLFSRHVHGFLPKPRSKSNSVRFAEEEFKMIKFFQVPAEEERADEEEEGKVPPREDISRPE